MLNILKSASFARTRIPRAFGRKGVFNTFFALHALWVERQRLKTMENHRLNDIGLSRDAADHEARRPVWDAPDRWLS